MNPTPHAHPLYEYQMLQTRRQFFSRTASTLMGALGLAALESVAAPVPQPARGLLGKLHFAPKARRIIYLFMSGAP